MGNQAWPNLPYKGLSYYGPDDIALFAGREDDVKQCAKILGQSSTRIVLLHGSTGCGKSSFLRAGLIPFLEKAGFQFLRDNNQSEVKALFVRSTNNPLAKLAEALFDFASQSYQYETLLSGTQTVELSGALLGHVNRTDFLEKVGTSAEMMVQALSKVAEMRPKTLVLVIDQAEEVLTVNAGEEGDKHREQFFEFMARFSRKKFDLKLLVALRTEFYGRFFNKIRQVGADAINIRDYLLTELKEEQLVRAIERPTLKDGVSFYGKPYDHYGFEYEIGDSNAPDAPERWGVVRTIARDLKLTALAGGELPVMQIVCGNLYRITKQKAQENGDSQWIIKKSDYLELGRIEGQMEGHLNRVLEDLCRENEILDLKTFDEIESWKQVLSSLVKTQVDGTVTTELSSAEALNKRAQAAGCNIPFNKGATYLSDEERRILRAVDVIDARTKKPVHCYSLGHDVIGLVLKSWLGETPSMKKAREAEEHLGYWNTQAKEAFQLGADGSRPSFWSRLRLIFAKPIPIRETVRLWRFADPDMRRILRRNLSGFFARVLVGVSMLVALSSISYMYYSRLIRNEDVQITKIKNDVPGILSKVNDVSGQLGVATWAKALINAGEIKEANRIVSQLRPTTDKEDENFRAARNLSDVYANVAAALFRAGKKPDAELLLKRAIELVKSVPIPEEESSRKYFTRYDQSQRLFAIARAYSEGAEFDNALEVIDKVPVQSMQSLYVAFLAAECAKAGQRAKADELWNEAMRRNEKASKEKEKDDPYELGASRFDIARVMANAGETDRALSILRQKSFVADNIRLGIINTQSEFETLLLISDALAKAGRFQNAIELIKTFVDDVDDNETSLIGTLTLAAIAQYTNQAGEQKQADEIWEKVKNRINKGKEINRRLSLRESFFSSSLLFEIASRAAKAGRFQLAVDTLEQAFPSEESDSTLDWQTQIAFNKTVKLIGESGDIATAHRFITKIKETYARGRALAELSRVLTKTGNIPQALDFARRDDDHYVKFKALMAIAETLIATGKSDAAKTILNEASGVAKRVGSDTEQSNAFAVIGKALACMHLYYDARLTADQSSSLGDKLQIYAAIFNEYIREKHPANNQPHENGCLEDYKDSLDSESQD